MNPAAAHLTLVTSYSPITDPVALTGEAEPGAYFTDGLTTLSNDVTVAFNSIATALWALRNESFPERITSDEDAVVLALAAGLRADCTRRKVGAVIFDVHGRVVITGRNGAAPGRPGCLTAGACPRGRFTTSQLPGYDQGNSDYSTGNGKCIATHAEANALMFSDPLARRGGFMAITDSPCDGCSNLVAGSGLHRVIWPVFAADGTVRIASRLAEHFGLAA